MSSPGQSIFSNSSWPEPLRFTISDEIIQGAELPKKAFVHDVFNEFEREISRRTDFEPERDVDDARTKARTAAEGEKTTEASITLDAKFEAVIEYYRYLLSKPILLLREKEALDAIGRLFYLYLFGSMEEVLEGVTNLTIIPDGILALVPFETLIMPDGRYLIEAYTITYVQSLSVSETITRRSYGKRDRPLLAFGGAVYNPLSYQKDMEASREQLARLEQKISDTLEEQESLRSAYGALGYGNWTNLPGSLAEVEAIGEIVPGSDIISGAAASEETVKRFSGTGKLREYRVLHFAVHGLAVPEVPSLSALVLSLEGGKEYGTAQEERTSGGEDGFLSVKEISRLDVAADFVNLSACETGLGKIYGGEGIVGLTQAFLVAGANGLSVSLWQVSDVATTEFMAGVYNMVESRGASYSEAIAHMKREFIRDRRRAAPFFWAPFVYYGE